MTLVSSTFINSKDKHCRSQWPRGLRRRSAAAHLLRLWLRIPQGASMFVCCECCVLSGRGLCDELITLPENSYRLWRVVVYDLEISWMRRPWPTGWVVPPKTKIKRNKHLNTNNVTRTPLPRLAVRTRVRSHAYLCSDYVVVEQVFVKVLRYSPSQ